MNVKLLYQIPLCYYTLHIMKIDKESTLLYWYSDDIDRPRQMTKVVSTVNVTG